VVVVVVMVGDGEVSGQSGLGMSRCGRKMDGNPFRTERRRGLESVGS
jgi:hypothetical protein